MLENWKNMEHKRDSDTNCDMYSHQRIDTGTGGVGNKRFSGDHPNDSIIKISHKTKKMPRNSSEKQTANLGMKNTQMNKI